MFEFDSDCSFVRGLSPFPKIDLDQVLCFILQESISQYLKHQYIFCAFQVAEESLLSFMLCILLKKQWIH